MADPKAPPPASENCLNCGYYETGYINFVGDDGVTRGVCTRYPPFPAASLSKDAIWPIVRETDWCGEWSATP